MDHGPITAPHAACAADHVLAYWQGLRRGRAVPARDDLDPGALQRWLDHAGIVEPAGAGHVRFRLGGRGLSRLMGVEVRGMPLRAMFAVEARDRLLALAGAMFEGPQVLDMTLVAQATGPDSRALPVRMVLLPLSDRTGTVSRALMYLGGDPGAAMIRPCRFHIRQARLTPLFAGPRLTGVRVDRGSGAPALRVIAGGRA